MQASIGQYSMHAGEPAHPVQQSVVMARMRGLFLRVALPSPTDMGQCFSSISNTLLFPSFPSASIMNYRSFIPYHRLSAALNEAKSICIEVVFPLTNGGRVPFAFSLA